MSKKQSTKTDKKINSLHDIDNYVVHKRVIDDFSDMNINGGIRNAFRGARGFTETEEQKLTEAYTKLFTEGLEALKDKE